MTDRTGILGPVADALEGIVVLDLSRLLPGPFLTMVLADMGADVIKVEDPRVGDYLRAFPPTKSGIGGRYLAVNRGKRSLALDLKQAAARAAFLRLVDRADVVNKNHPRHPPSNHLCQEVPDTMHSERS